MGLTRSLRNKLINIMERGLMLKAIALNVGIDVKDLSRFKGGMECLKDSEVKLLSEYLNAVVIPQWTKITRDSKKPVTKLEVMRKRMEKRQDIS